MTKINNYYSTFITLRGAKNVVGRFKKQGVLGKIKSIPGERWIPTKKGVKVIKSKNYEVYLSKIAMPGI